ncbi:unnamed protein product [Vitrella brassicaformis CCMP3155]|uniref:Uncharacterized protein n=1 Tax=Vitrella brassicaformis (strain CCMP3155) TaxID=1169540 RepID=A0A0G4ESB5_VITBC|nr:unnamed protein product [Vitrella brassicaformis CCMP3155]|eukprot:CEM00807.1 unnamed protein product [Vitrella brassicaformis CCMP3155]
MAKGHCPSREEGVDGTLLGDGDGAEDPPQPNGQQAAASASMTVDDVVRDVIGRVPGLVVRFIAFLPLHLLMQLSRHSREQAVPHQNHQHGHGSRAVFLATTAPRNHPGTGRMAHTADGHHPPLPSRYRWLVLRRYGDDR